MRSKRNSPQIVMFKRVMNVIAVTVLVFVILLTSLTLNSAQAATNLDRKIPTNTAANLQGTATPTPTIQVKTGEPFRISFASLGYGDVTLESPRGNARIAFRLPRNWAITTDGMLDLNISYNFNQFVSQDLPPVFGNLTITLDGEPLTEFFISEVALENYRLQVPLPAALLGDISRGQHLLGFRFDAKILCETPHEGKLIIDPASTISFNYTLRPLELDLSKYPQPFYQPDFASEDTLRFILPNQSTSDIATGVVAMAAKLGDLTNNRLVLTTTTDVDYVKQIPANKSITSPEHLVVIGKPQDNQLLMLLNKEAELPVSLYQQQLDVQTEGPTSIIPGKTFSYIFTLTNTLNRSVNLSLASRVPVATEFVECTGDCAKRVREKSVIWENESLATNETLTLALTLKATDTLTGSWVENTITVNEANSGPVNAATFTSTISSNMDNDQNKVLATKKGDYFFAYDGRAVAGDDGIVQEIFAPWNANQVILLITGLTDDALRKASQAMSSESRFPGMRGPVALIRNALRPDEIINDPQSGLKVTFEELGYADQIMRGDSSQNVDFFFDVPLGWQLTQDAYLDLFFNHSQLIKLENSGVTVLFNRKPVASLALTPETALDGSLRVKLSNVEIQTTRPNRITVQVNMATPPTAKCVDAESEQAWFVVSRSSTIFLAHKTNPNVKLDLANYPYPFNAPSTLSKFLLALPSTPTNAEWGIALNLASSIGSSSRSRTLVPSATMGAEKLSAEVLAEYNIVAVGRPSRNDLIQQANEDLPQPFIPGSDEIDQRLDDVIFRLSADLSLGYIQLISSPWNKDNAFLALTGTTDDSVQLSVKTINQRRRLPGDLVLVREDQINSFDTRTLTQQGVAAAVATAVPEVTAVASKTEAVATPTPPVATPVSAIPQPKSTAGTTAVAEQTVPQSDRPGWLMPLLGVNGILVVAIVAFGYWRSRHRA